MHAPSTSEFIFIRIRAAAALLVRGDRALDLLEDPLAQVVRAPTSTRRYARGRAKPVRQLNMSATSAPISSSHVNRPKSVYRRAVLGW